MGEPGIGKSLLAIDLAARVTTFAPPPPAPPIAQPQLDPADLPDDRHISDFRPATAIILSRDDNIDTLTFRFNAARGNFDFAKFPDSDLSLVPPRPLRQREPKSIEELAPILRWYVENITDALNPRLLILDPLPAFLGTHDSGHQGAIRELLRPLLNTAYYYKFAVLGITHLKKSSQQFQHPLHRAMGSLAYTALARNVFMVTPYTPPTPPSPPPPRGGDNGALPTEPSSETPNPPPPGPSPSSIHNSSFIIPPNRLLLPIKCNISESPPALGFSIGKNQFGPTIHWHPTPITDHPFANIDPHDTLPERIIRSQLELARDFLTITLAQGPIPSATLLKQARAIGISRRTFDRARATLDARTFHDGHSGIWVTALPKFTKCA